jgi:hypothetical protein
MGRFVTGTFRDQGHFVTGSFRDGLFCDGVFCDGSFRDGSFCMGITNTSQVKHHRIIVKPICHFVSQMILYLEPLLQCVGVLSSGRCRKTLQACSRKICQIM